MAQVKHTDAERAVAIELLAGGSSFRAASRATGIHHSTLARWQKEDEEFADAIRQLKRPLAEIAEEVVREGWRIVVERLRDPDHEMDDASLNRFVGTAVDKIAALTANTEGDEQRDAFATMTHDERVAYLAEKLPPEMLAAVQEMQARKVH